MTFTVVEWFVLVFIVIGIIKTFTVIFNPKSWMKVVRFLYGNGVVLFIVELILAAVLFYSLIQQFTIVQIMAVIVLGALLTGMSFALYNKETISWADKILKVKTLFGRAWIPILIWLALMIWALVELFW